MCYKNRILNPPEAAVPFERIGIDLTSPYRTKGVRTGISWAFSKLKSLDFVNSSSDELKVAGRQSCQSTVPRRVNIGLGLRPYAVLGNPANLKNLEHLVGRLDFIRYYRIHSAPCFYTSSVIFKRISATMCFLYLFLPKKIP